VAATKKTKQGFEVDAGIAEFISILNDCGWISTIDSCSGLKQDHGQYSVNIIPYLTFHTKEGKRLIDGGTPDDFRLLTAIKNARWFLDLHHGTPIAYALPPMLYRAPSTRPLSPEQKRDLDLTAMFVSTVLDITDDEKIEKWKDLVASITNTFCPNKNPYPDREITPVEYNDHPRYGYDVLLFNHFISEELKRDLLDMIKRRQWGG